MLKRGKGLSEQEKAIFDLNDAVFSYDYSAYLRSLTDPLDIEFAQLRRRYQSSYEHVAVHHCTFTHKFLHLIGLEDFPDFQESKELKFEVRVEETQLTFRVTSEALSDELREALAKEVKSCCLRLKSFVRGLAYIDTHIAEVLQECRRCLVYIDEEDKDDEADYLEDYHDDFAVVKRISQAPRPVQRPKPKAKEELRSAPVARGYVPKDKPDRLRLTTSEMNLYGIGTASLISIVLQGHCKNCNEIRTLELTSSGKELLHSKVCVCGRLHELVLKPQFASLASFELGRLACRGLRYLMAISMSFAVSCDSCLEDFAVSVVPQVSCVANCTHCMHKFHFKVDQVNLTPEPTLERQADTPKKLKKSAGLHPGSALPEQGTCKHYKQSYRWLKFPCCNQAFPCDDCHNEVAGHVAEFANRMICGFCSREQNYSSSQVCSSCKADVTGKGKSNRRFWEGGKGCRDSTKLSRNDQRKHKNK
jgi:uncharacterized CHY-type Zn-finger protein